MIDDRTNAPGDARCPGPSTRELFQRDRTGAPAPFVEASYRFRGDEDIPFSNYTSKEYLQAEYDHMWSRVWQWACREEHIPNVGDYYVYDIGDRSIIVTRTASGIKAYNNFCLHRGTQFEGQRGVDGHRAAAVDVGVARAGVEADAAHPDGDQSITGAPGERMAAGLRGVPYSGAQERTGE